jgi:hypothetical protein
MSEAMRCGPMFDVAIQTCDQSFLSVFRDHLPDDVLISE